MVAGNDSNRPVPMVTSVVNMAASLETSSLGVINCSAVADGNSTDAEVQFSR